MADEDIAFWLLGFFNNLAYVILLACAKTLSEGGTAVVYLANIVPTLVVKASAPYWFDRVSYDVRIYTASVLMLVSLGLVASSLTLPWQLVGVALSSLQCGLGEASLLALAGKLDSKKSNKRCLASFSSGTGLSGPMGYAWKVVWNDVLGWTLSSTLWLAAVCLFVGYGGIYHVQLQRTTNDEDDEYEQVIQQEALDNQQQQQQQQVVKTHADQQLQQEECEQSMMMIEDQSNNNQDETDPLLSIAVSEMTALQRLQFVVFRLYKYTIPLFVVYFGEYACQAGAWTSMAVLPSRVHDVQSRNAFYQTSNWLYQAGVFISRSSALLLPSIIPLWLLWLLPGLQVGNLLLFSWIAWPHAAASSSLQQVLYHGYLLYPLALYTGLLGGAVYVQGYQRIVADYSRPTAAAAANGHHAEFALAATSVAEGLGIVVADVFALILQGCLYQANDAIEEKALIESCPI